MKNKLQNAPEKSEVFCVVGNLKKERFVLRGGTLRFIFSERFVLRIIRACYIRNILHIHDRFDHGTNIFGVHFTRYLCEFTAFLARH